MKSLLTILLILTIRFSVAAQEPRIDQGQTAEAAVNNSLNEIRHKRKALLMVFRSRVLDLSDGDQAIIDDVLKADPRPKGRYRWVYSVMAHKLNKYIHKYKSLSAATELSDADYVIFFNVVEFRRILNTYYPYGELFVIVKGSPETMTPPRVIWRARKILIAEEAIGNLIKELKNIRGES